MEQEYNVNSKLSELQKRKQQLKSLRELHKPMNHQDLKTHAMQHDVQVRRRELEKREERGTFHKQLGK